MNNASLSLMYFNVVDALVKQIIILTGGNTIKLGGNARQAEIDEVMKMMVACFSVYCDGNIRENKYKAEALLIAVCNANELPLRIYCYIKRRIIYF